MPLPFLAAIPAIFSAISGVSDLFSEGRKAYETITGTAAPEDPAGLRAAVDELPDDQKESWAGTMAERIQMYEAQTDRLKVQGGTLDAETLAQFSPSTRDKIGRMRMITRPLVVRRMTHVLLLPVYVTVFDMAATLINSAVRTFDGKLIVPLLAQDFFKDGSLYTGLYGQVVLTAGGIVITYMTLRELGKAGGPKQVAQSTIQRLAGSIGNIVGTFRK